MLRLCSRRIVLECYLRFTEVNGKLPNLTKNVNFSFVENKTISLGFSSKGFGFCTTSTNVVSDNPFEAQIAEIAGDDGDLEHKLRVIILEAEVFRQEGRAVPSYEFFKTKHLQELLKLASKSGRRKYLEFLFKIEKKKENLIRKKEEKLIEKGEKVAKDPLDVTNYELGGNNIFVRFRESTIMNFYNYRLCQAAQFGQKIVVDCGYNESMTEREQRNCAKQIMMLFADNRFHDDPYDLHFCNTHAAEFLLKQVGKLIPTMNDPHFLMNIHTESYLDMFPKDRLVYLTPHCREVLREYDHNDIYIIGAIVDKVNCEPLSLAKAKKEGLRMAKLPLDQYLEWGAGSGKSLTLNQVMSIMLDMKVSGDWDHALRHVPRRKLADFTNKIADRKLERQIGVHDGSIQRMRSSWKPKDGGQLDQLSYRKPSRHLDSEPEDSRRVPERGRVSATELLLNYNRGIKK